MAVSRSGGILIFEKCFGSFYFDDKVSRYSYQIKHLTQDEVNNLAIQIEKDGSQVNDSEIWNFINQARNYRPSVESLSYLPISLMQPGEVLELTLADNVSKSVKLMKMNDEKMLLWCMQGNSSFIPSNVIDASTERVFNCHDTFLDFGRVSSLNLLHPGYYHRTIDYCLLSSSYYDKGPENLMPLYNCLVNMHYNNEITGNFDDVINLTSENGISTFVLRQMLDFITGYANVER